jgi:hypothetical protein
VHPALSRELSHAGVDDGEPSASGLPRRERLWVVAPMVCPVAIVVPAGARPRGEDLVVEVPPRQLPGEGSLGLRAAQPL